MKKYDIGAGSATLAEFDTKEELDTYFDKMKDIDRHFCRVYNNEEKTNIPGWNYQYTHDFNRRF